MTGIPCVSEALHCAVREPTVEQRARAIMRHGVLRKRDDVEGVQFRAELPDGAVYVVAIPLLQFAVWKRAALYEADVETTARQYVLERLVEQLTEEGCR